jgi:CO dehydrogenase/acetyl-CoA synthase epsilon subunit
MKLGRSDLFILGAAFLSFLFSVSLWFGLLGEGNRDTAIFVGLWVPSILALGLYGTTTRRSV